MVLLRDLVLLLLQLNIEFKAEHVTTKDNYLADALSRQQVERFKSLAPVVDVAPTIIPHHLLPESYDVTFNAF